MKIRIISLFLSLALTLISTYEYISMSIPVDESSSKSIEYSFEKNEKKQSDKHQDDTYYHSSPSLFVTFTNTTNEHSILGTHSFELQNPIYRPPIS